MTNSTGNKQSAEERIYDGEFKLSDILHAIWRIRWFVLVSMLLGAMAIIGFLALTRIALPSEQIFQSAVRFVFPSVDTTVKESPGKKKFGVRNRLKQKKYPNGRLFSISDMVAPAILQRVYEQNNLQEFKIEPGEFAAAVSVLPYAPVYDEIASRYRSELSDRKLKFAERQLIEESMFRELTEMASKGALITLTLNSRFGIPENLGRKIVNDISSTWAKFSIEQLGVLKLPDLVVSSNPIDIGFLQTLDTASSLLLQDESVQELRKRIKSISDLGGADSVIDEKSGYTLQDLQRQLSMFGNYRLKKLWGHLLATGSIDQSSSTLVAFQSRRDQLKFMENALTQEAADLDRALNTYSARSVVPANEGRKTVVARPQGPAVPQLSAGFLDRLVAFAADQQDIAFRQNMVDRQIKLNQSAMAISLEIERLNGFIDGIKNIQSQADPSDLGAQKHIKTDLQETAITLNGYWEIASHLFAQLNEKRLSYDSRLYVKLPLSSKAQASISHPVFNNRTYIIAIAALIAIGMFSLVAGLMWQILRDRIRQTQ